MDAVLCMDIVAYWQLLASNSGLVQQIVSIYVPVV